MDWTGEGTETVLHGGDANPRDGRAARKLDPVRTRQDILAAAREEFAEKGLSGARVDAIAARTRTTKRMIYYYFGSKEGLYLAVLEQAYGAIRAVEQTLELQRQPPVEGVRRLVEFTFDYQEANPDFIRLVSIENIHHGKYLAQSEAIRTLNLPIIEALGALLSRGTEEGVFRADVDAVDLHMLISAFCFFRVSNRHTFSALFERDLASPEVQARHKQLIADAIIGVLEGGPGRA